jgi:PKD repeat protein
MIDSLRWQVNPGGAGVWTDIYDDANYSGTTTQQLSIVNIPLAFNTNQYRLGLKAFCDTVYTNAATLTVNSNPVVNFASDTILACGGVTIPIDPDPSGGSGSWSQHVWTGDIGALSNYFVEVPNFRSLIPGPYNLHYRVRDTNGCYGEGDVVVSVDSPDATYTQDLSMMCTPDTVTFTKDMTGITSFTWNFGDGTPVNTVDANPVHIFTNANPTAIEYYNVSLTVVSAAGCTATYAQMTTVYPAIDATFTANTDTICSGSTVIFTALSGANNYFWDYGDLASGPGSYVSTHLYVNTTTAPITRTVTLTTTSFYGCMDVKTVDIVVMPVPIPQFIAAPTPQTFDPAGNVVNFTNQTNPGTWNYFWRFGDGGTSTQDNPSHTYTNVGTFNVTLIVDNVNCKDSVTHQVNILPIPPVANFDSIPSGCEPLYISPNNTSLNTETPGTTYRWDFGDGNYSTVKNPTYTYYNPGTYRIELTVTGPGGTSIKSQIVNVYVSPRAYFEVTPSLVFVNDERVRCFNLSQFADSYLWEFGDGDTSRLKEPFHRYMEEGVYDITLWAYSNNGCSDVYVLSPAVTVEPAGEVRFSTVFTPNKEGPIERTDLPTGGTEMDQFFFPPIREKVINYKLQIFNRLGVLIFESRNINVPWNGYYKGQLCPQGVYVWYVEGKYANGEPFKKVGDVTLLH